MKNEATLRITLDNCLYFVMFVFITAVVLLSSLIPFASDTAKEVLNKIPLLCRLSLLILAIWDNFITSKERLIKCAFFSSIFILSYFAIGSWNLYDLFFIAVSFKEKNRNSLLKTYMYALLFSLSVVMVLYFIGFMPEFVLYRGNKIRYTFGFSHPNGLGRVLLILCVLYVILKEDKIKKKEIAAIFLVAVFLFIYPNSNSSAVLILLLCCFCLLKNFYEKNNKKLINSKLFVSGCIALVPFLIALTVFMTIKYRQDTTFAMNLPETIRSRIVLGLRGLENYGVRLFGNNNIAFSSTSNIYFNASGIKSEYFVLDSLFYFLPIKHGLIPTIYFLGMYLIYILKSIKNKDVYLLMAFVILMVYSIFENGVVSNSAIYCSFIFVVAQSKRDTIDSSDITEQPKETFHPKIDVLESFHVL